MENGLILGTILGMALVTYVPRLLPILALSDKRLPILLERWLNQIPVAVLAALVAPSLLTDQGRLYLAFDNIFLWASFPTILVAWKTRNLFTSVLVGIGIIALVRLLSAA